MAIRRAADRIQNAGLVPWLAVALFLLAGAAFGQDRTEAHERDAGTGERFAVPSEPSSPPPSAAPSAPSEPSAGSSDSGSSDSGSSDSSEPRHAVPTGPSDHSGRPERQPPTRHDHGGGVHGGAGIDGGYYAPYYPYGFFGFGWGWYGNDYDNGPYPDDPEPSYGRGARETKGALDLDISPGRTQVYLDGQKIGKADDFDGWPRYLWLPRGTYEVVFYLDGYKTLVRHMTIHAGVVIDMDDRMERGPSIRPEDLPAGAQ